MEDLQNPRDTTENDVTPTISTSLQTVPSKKAPGTFYRYILFAIAVLAITVSVFVLLAMQSIPGGTLYSTKTSIIEKVLEKSHLSNKSKTLYQVTLLQNRLTEVQKLTQLENVSPEAQMALINSINRHGTTLESLIGASIDGAFPKTDVLFVLNDFASVAGAIENISENDTKLQVTGDAAEDVRNITVSLYKERALSFVQTENPADVYTYIANQLDTVKENLGKGEVSEDVRRKVELYLDRVDPAITKGDLTKVIVSIAEAYRFVAMEGYSGIIMREEVPTATTDTNASTSETTVSASTTEIKTEEITIP
jgi:hypothetical protein